MTGAGEKAFVAGADIQELAGHTPASGREAALYGQSVFEPAGDDGQAFHRGDQRICAGRRLRAGAGVHGAAGQPHGKAGAAGSEAGTDAGYGGTQRLARLCGPGVAQELCLSGEMISAEEAQRIGLVNHVYEPQELLPAAEALARKFAANAPVAVRLAMEAIRRGAQVPLEEGLALEATLFAMCCGTADMAEGTRAFLEKRPARFQGR